MGAVFSRPNSVNPELSVLVRCFNQADILEQAVRDCIRMVSRTTESFETILINDGSTDGSVRILDRLRKEFPNVRVTHQLRSGQAKAVRRGIDLARGTYFLQVPLDQIPWLEDFAPLWQLRQKHAFILGHHPSPGNRSHRMVSWLLRGWTKVWFGTELVEPDTNFRLCRRSVMLEHLGELPKSSEAVNLGLSLKVFLSDPNQLKEVVTGSQCLAPRSRLAADISKLFYYFIEIPRFRLSSSPSLVLRTAKESL
jgi:hypothetical protein